MTTRRGCADRETGKRMPNAAPSRADRPAAVAAKLEYRARQPGCQGRIPRGRLETQLPGIPQDGRRQVVP